MRRPDDVRLDFTREWVRKAEGDFKAARFLGTSGEEFFFGTAFHAQQCAEKYLKAFLVWNQVEFPKTHDMKDLLAFVSKVDAPLSRCLSDAIELTPYGVEYRYPGQYPELARKDVRRSLAVCRSVRREIRKRLPRKALTNPRPAVTRSSKKRLSKRM